MNIKYVSVLVFTCFTFLSAQSWQNFTINNCPLPSNQINSIVISNDGTVWFGTDNGLASIKNNAWKTYSTDDGLSSDKINSLSFLPNGTNNLWLATNYGSTNFLIDSTDINSELNYINKTSYDILSDTLFSLEMDSSQNQWIGTLEGLSVLTNTGIYNISEINGLPNNKVNNINSRSNEWVHVGTAGGGVARLKYDEVDGITSASNIITTWSFLASDTVLTIYVTDDTLRWYGTTKGVSTHFGDKTKDVPVSQGGSWWIFNTTTSGIIDNYVRAITGDSEGNMWFGTRNGLSNYNTIDSTWRSFTEEDGLVSNNIFDVEIDKENNVWIATDKGVSKLSEFAVGITASPAPAKYELKISAYPNPFNPSTTIQYTISNYANVKLIIYNINGEKVITLVDSYKHAGNHKVVWNAANNLGNKLSSGVYFISIETGKFRAVQKITLLR